MRGLLPLAVTVLALVGPSLTGASDSEGSLELQELSETPHDAFLQSKGFDDEESRESSHNENDTSSTGTWGNGLTDIHQAAEAASHTLSRLFFPQGEGVQDAISDKGRTADMRAIAAAEVAPAAMKFNTAIKAAAERAAGKAVGTQQQQRRDFDQVVAAARETMAAAFTAAEQYRQEASSSLSAAGNKTKWQLQSALKALQKPVDGLLAAAADSPVGRDVQHIIELIREGKPLNLSDPADRSSLRSLILSVAVFTLLLRETNEGADKYWRRMRPIIATLLQFLGEDHTESKGKSVARKTQNGAKNLGKGDSSDFDAKSADALNGLLRGLLETGEEEVRDDGGEGDSEAALGALMEFLKRRTNKRIRRSRSHRGKH